MYKPFHYSSYNYIYYFMSKKRGTKMLYSQEELKMEAKKHNLSFDGEAENYLGNFAYYQFTTVEGRTFGIKKLEDLPAKIEEVRIRFEGK